MGLIDKLRNDGSAFQSPAGLDAVSPQIGATRQSKLHRDYSLDGNHVADVNNQLNQYDDGVNNLIPVPSLLDLNGSRPHSPLSDPNFASINNSFQNGTYRDTLNNQMIGYSGTF